MDVKRIQREFSDAQNYFAYLELHPTTAGKVYARTALQTSEGLYVLSIRFPDSYPNLTFVIKRAAKWLSKYEVWRQRGRWPGASIKH
jgi:hypothetical protein